MGHIGPMRPIRLILFFLCIIVSPAQAYWQQQVRCDNQSAKFEITGTIMRVVLSKPLSPGDSVQIAFPFREQIPRQIRRSGWMSREGVEYSMSQWYPKLAEYDYEGWHRQEYVSHEF